MRDEAEIRGHRRTYIGALPGQIIQGLRRAESRNPVFILDEIDKLGADFRGDPASALLEVLDPEQNNTFRDHYLDVPFDLSEVLFITTANVLDTIPAPLRDRMEVLELPGYTEHEKRRIARDHLVAKQIANHGLDRRPGHVHRRGAGHDHPAATRARRACASSSARSARSAASSPGGRPRARRRRSTSRRRSSRSCSARRCYLDELMKDRTKDPGVAIGLAWTPVGGDVLFVEASRMAGGSQLTLTGHLGDVMKESARIALSWFRANAARYGVDPQFYKDSEIHLHVPSGRDPEGRAVGRRDDGHGARLGAHRAARARRRRDDGRDHALGTRAARGRHQGKGAGRAAPRRARSDSAAAEREERARGPRRRAAPGPDGALRRRNGRGACASPSCRRACRAPRRDRGAHGSVSRSERSTAEPRS